MRKIDELLQRVPPNPLYHYTSPNGLLGIMQDQEIWASSAYHLNDSREFRYATSLIVDRLEERGKDEHGPNNPIYGRLVDDMSTLTSRVSVFVASFSEEGVEQDLSKTLTAAAAMKHPGFKREAEWRLVKTIGAGLGLENGLCFRQGRNGVVPYLKAPLALNKEEFIPKSIHIGPSDDAEASRMAVNALLDSRGLLPSLGNRRVEVLVSKTPYRP